ncbi:hypothetical protein E2C01_065062 [Portunus trituberculatus]|uniref:Uncharacterized protein n=1 Tax=Portunus trituberculatus TaxID=210409 RepID=A0A5B7HKV6_PORTR|nr:hypothetical protein [Portunus trituberculatus]
MPSERTERGASGNQQKEDLSKTEEKIESRQTERTKRRRGYGTLRPANFPTSILTALRISSPAVLVWGDKMVGRKVGGHKQSGTAVAKELLNPFSYRRSVG